MWKLRLWWWWCLTAPNSPGVSSLAKPTGNWSTTQLCYFPTRGSSPGASIHHDQPAADQPWTCAPYVLKRRRIQPKDASQSICGFGISRGELQSAQRGACKRGWHGGCQRRRSKALVRRRPVSQGGGCILPTATTLLVTVSLTGLVGCHAHTLMATFQSCFKLLKELVFFSVRRASMAQRETRASTGGDMNNHEIRVNQWALPFSQLP